MPPHGLYPIPRHYLHGSSPTTRPVFNSQEFEGQNADLPVPNSDSGLPLLLTEESQIDTPIGEKRDKKKRKKKKNKAKRRHSHPLYSSNYCKAGDPWLTGREEQYGKGSH